MSINNAANLVASNSNNLPFMVGHFLILSLPDASLYAGGLAIVTNGDGGNIRSVYSDGSDWRFIYNNNIVSLNPSAPTENETHDLELIAFEYIPAGSLVTLVVDGGVLKAKLAGYSFGIEGRAEGFVKDTVDIDETAYVYRKRGLIIPKNDLTLNADYYLVDDGNVDVFPDNSPIPEGYIIQFIGKCLPDGLEFDPGQAILRG